MKISLLSTVFVLLIISSAVSAQAVDLSLRKAVYFTGDKTDKIDLKNDKYATSGREFQLSAELAKACDDQGCEFNLGVIGVRSGASTEPLSGYGMFTVENGGLVGNTIVFEAKQTSKQLVLPVKLKLGKTRLTVSIDPYKKVDETDEENNTFSVDVVVTPKTASSDTLRMRPKPQL
jgi:CARDB